MINPTYPTYNQGYSPLSKWDEPPSKMGVSENIFFFRHIMFILVGKIHERSD